jgi:pimeloyl-ACP methyl ester carboxylesterase
MGSGPEVVFCHGTPWSSELWRPYAEALAEHYRVYLWDMPGYGQSSKRAEHPVSLDVQGELLADLLAHWGVHSPHVVAHDLGGAVALRAYLLHRAVFASLALVDVVALAPWGSDFFRLAGEHADVFSALPPSIHDGLLRSYIAGASHVGLSPGAMEMLVSPCGVALRDRLPSIVRSLRRTSATPTRWSPDTPRWTFQRWWSGGNRTRGSRSTVLIAWAQLFPGHGPS